MYKSQSKQFHQMSFLAFNQTCGMQLDRKNIWVRIADSMDWAKCETQYAKLFPSSTGRPAKPFRMVLGALIIQKREGFSDRELVKAIAENPYYQYFIGLEGFQIECPFKDSIVSNWRKRLDMYDIIDINEIYLETAAPTPSHAKDKEQEPAENGNLGTVILDATCSPSNIRYPQDFSICEECRVKLDEMIDYFHKTYHPWAKPRTYRRIARKRYLTIAKSKKKKPEEIRRFIRQELECIKRDIGYLEKYMSEGYALNKKYVDTYHTILKIYEQQKYMYDNKVHRVEDRIVSVTQPHIRPIVRGKAKAPVEFGAKYDVSIDEKGHARLEMIDFNPYNEGGVLQDALMMYFERTGHFPQRVLVDQIYRTRENIAFCKEHGIRISGPKLGRPKKNARTEKETKTAHKDNNDRIEVERFFSLEKGCNGGGLITTKLEDTSLTSIALSVLVTNMFATTPAKSFYLFLFDNRNDETGPKCASFVDVA